MHAQASSQFAAVSKTCEPGTPGSAAWEYSRWPIATWRPSASNSTARTEPVPASMASRSSFIDGERGPVGDVHERLSCREALDLGGDHLDAAEQRLVGRAADVRRQHHVGVAKQRVRAGRRLGLDDVERRTGQVAGRQRVGQRLLVDQRLAGGVQEVAPGLHRRERGGVEQPRVLGGRPRVHRDEVRPAEELGERVDPFHAVRRRRRRGTGRGRGSASRTPAPGSRPGGRRCPNPTSPSVWPTRSWPKNCAPSNVDPPARFPPARNRCASGNRRASMTMKASAWSATDSAFFPGVVTTGMPRSVAAAVSTLTGPPRAQQTRRSVGPRRGRGR